MSEKENHTAEVEALKARVAELEAENKKPKATTTDTTKMLTAYVDLRLYIELKSTLKPL